MASPPLNVFAHTVDVARVYEVLAGTEAKLQLIDGTPADWRHLRLTWRTGWLSRGMVLDCQHNPDYYAGDSWRGQLQGMMRYFSSQGRPPSGQAQAFIRSLGFSVSFQGEGLVPGGDDPRWAAIQAVCRAIDGAVFVPGAFFSADGHLLFSVEGPGDPSARWPAEQPPHPRLVPSGALYDTEGASPVRQKNLAWLRSRGFLAPGKLPSSPVALRDPTETATRLFALWAACSWVLADAPDDAIVAFVQHNNLPRLALDGTVGGGAVLDLPRSEARAQSGRIGWRLENLWSLSWVLGFSPAPRVDGQMVGDDVLSPLAQQFLPALDARLDDWLRRQTPRSPKEVCALEDRFYCAHHAVRSAQLGLATVPPGFDAFMGGGVIHERRQALSWACHPGVDWDDGLLVAT